jgi:hypothetical protein
LGIEGRCDEQMTVLIISTGRVRKDDRFTAQICTRGEGKQAEMERKGWKPWLRRDLSRDPTRTNRKQGRIKENLKEKN